MLVVDIGVIVFSWLSSYYLRFISGFFLIPKGVPDFSHYIQATPIIILIWAVSLQVGGLYHQMRSDSRFHEYFRIFRTATISLLLMVAAMFFYRGFEFSRLMMGIFWLLSIFSLTVSHTVVRTILRNVRKRGYNLRYVLIVGAGELGQTLAGVFARHPESGLKVVGLLGDADDEVGNKVNGYDVIGTIDQVKEKIKEHEIDQIFIALPRHASDRMEKTLNLLGDETVDVKLAPDLLQFMRLNSGVEDFEGIPIVSLSESPMYGWNVVLKRMFDIAVSILATIIWSPVLLVISIIIKLESKGPLLYKQDRMSLGGGKFVIYKFRSMTIDAERETGAVWANSKDDRRTKTGKFLRKTSLDELPQLFNVLKGDMSLVGPRPLPISQIQKEDFRQLQRLEVRPGITGLWQIRGRSDISFVRLVKWDVWYINNWSFWLDLNILFQTVPVVFRGKGAY